MTQQIELACEDVVFHFNKKHLEDSTVPMWVLKTHGETYYVSHVDCSVPWSTKETPDNSHTKGSIKVKNVLLVIDENNEATIKTLTVFDKIRLRNQKRGITRIIFAWGSPMHKALASNEFKHSTFKNITGACSSTFVVCDMLKKEEVTFASLKYDFRILMPNETYYRAYDNVKGDIDVDYTDEDTPYEYS